MRTTRILAAVFATVFAVVAVSPAPASAKPLRAELIPTVATR